MKQRSEISKKNKTNNKLNVASYRVRDLAEEYGINIGIERDQEASLFQYLKNNGEVSLAKILENLSKGLKQAH